MAGIKRTDAQFDHALRRAARRDNLEHGKHVDAPADAHHSQVVEETQTGNAASNTASEVSVAFANTYEKVVAVASFGSLVSPLSDAACTAYNYTTDVDGNVTGVDVAFENSTANALTIEVRAIGVAV